LILIADSGSTKTDWRLIDDNKQIHQFSSQGINPYFQTSEQISEILRSELLPQISALSAAADQISQLPSPNSELPSPNSKLPTQLFFYGAGCRVEDKKQIVMSALKENFPTAEIEIHTDLLGAARSLCGSKPGIAAILGTGANTCYYDGEKIAENRTSLGYVLGDEGSGAHIGKTFIQAYLNDELPTDLSNRFYERFKLSKDEIIDAVYKKPMPNRFLASFSKFIYQNLKEQYVLDLVADCFRQFFDKHICKYEKHKELKLSCTGSVAFYYSNILRAVAADKGVNIDTIVETPISGLTLYHLGEE
jgi:N-acetylglucosamine kinase-like BadF-type ATPase